MIMARHELSNLPAAHDWSRTASGCQTTSGRIRFLGRLPVSEIETIPLASPRNASRLITGQFGNSLLQPLNLSQRLCTLFFERI